MCCEMLFCTSEVRQMTGICQKSGKDHNKEMTAKTGHGLDA